MKDLFERLAVLRTSGIGPVKYAKLINDHGNAAAALEFLKPNQDHLDSIKKEMDLAEKLNVHYITNDSEFYPANLLKVRNCPPVITARGNLETLKKPAVGIVGTRHATAAGMRLTAEIAQKFASNGYAVASGMAMGTDTAAHKGALAAAGDSNTIAVLAGGPDYIWPLENEKLYHYILERGVVVSEMAPGFEPVATNFVQRNRWVAGISETLIIGEADIKSGSMTTAKFANDYGRRILAIPGHPSDSRSVGPNTLIRDKIASMCMGADDFFGIDATKKEKEKNIPKKDSSLSDFLGIVPLSESVLAELAKKNIGEVKRELIMLELNGVVKRVNGGFVLY
jgi:DNA processing protein